MTLSSKQLDLEKARQDIHSYLKDYQHRELLRFVVVGSVDDGKSTLIGRLLHDTGQVFEDQLEDARRNSGPDEEIDFALLTDGLKAEREQGITIDVAYRYFSTTRRKYIIADTPGHVQYTRNMATGASTADVAIILIDARLGVQQQSKRHAYIASLLGIRHLVVAVNKMDVVDYREDVFQSISDEFGSFSDKLDFKDVLFFPVSAKMGDNVVAESDNTPWYDGKTIMEHLETVPIRNDRNFEDFRMPVQYVIRPHQDYRGFAGQVASGTVKPGDPVVVVPSMKESRVKSIDTYDGPLQEAFPPMSITLRLEDEVDVSRGDMLVHPDNIPYKSRHLDAILVWMNDKPLNPTKSYLIKHTTHVVRADINEVVWKSDPNTLNELPTDNLELNDIGFVRWTCHRPMTYDPYKKNRSTGAFIVIDPLTNETMAAGMLQEPERRDGDESITYMGFQAESEWIEQSSGSLRWDDPAWQALNEDERTNLSCQQGGVLFFHGGKEKENSVLAYSLEQRLLTLGYFPRVHHWNEHPSQEDKQRLQASIELGVLTLVIAPSQTSVTLSEFVPAETTLLSVALLASAPESSEATPTNGTLGKPLQVFRDENLAQAHERILTHLIAEGLLLYPRS